VTRTAVLLQAVRAVYGAALLLVPGRVIRACTGNQAGARTRAVARVLGARHLAQVAVTAGSGPSAESLGLGAAVDIAHAASMAVLALADRRLRRVTLTDALIETAFAAAGVSSAVPPRARCRRGPGDAGGQVTPRRTDLYRATI
jgi:hypothetical protein